MSAASLIAAAFAGPASAASSKTGQGLSPLVTAVSCSGYGCDGTDPQSSGCAATAETVASAWVNYPYSKVELRYSTACRTTWARASGWPEDPDYPNDYAYIHRNSDGRQYTCYGGYTRQTTSCYTRQVYDGGVTSYAYAFEEGPASSSGRTTSY
ncbi:MAG: DUF2690 domain-containing protein [Jatrophihabitantaceae bacterium]